jgi:hypothetical protein
MATLPLIDFDGLMQIQAAQAQASSDVDNLDLEVGSVLRAALEANGAIVLHAQTVALLVLWMTRLATSSGSDVDSFIADFGMSPPRLAAVPSSGPVTISRLSPVSAATILVGSLARTGDLSLDFEIIADPSNPCFSPSTGPRGGFIIPPGTATITVQVVCTTPGTIGNVTANAVSLPGSGMDAITYCDNGAPFANGVDAESDNALRARFVNWVAGLAKATEAAINAAIGSVQQGLSWNLQENVDETGAACQGQFIAIVDDGSGDTPDNVLASVYTAVDQVRAFTVKPIVHRASVLSVTITVTLTVPTGVTKPIAAVQNAIAAYVAALGEGQTLPFTKLASVVYQASSDITNAVITINGGTSDLVASTGQVIRIATVAVS